MTITSILFMKLPDIQYFENSKTYSILISCGVTLPCEHFINNTGDGMPQLFEHLHPQRRPHGVSQVEQREVAVSTFHLITQAPFQGRNKARNLHNKLIQPRAGIRQE